MFLLWGLSNVSSNQQTTETALWGWLNSSTGRRISKWEGRKPKAALGGSRGGDLDFGNSGNVGSARVLGAGPPNLLVGWRRHGMPDLDPGASAHPPRLVPLGSLPHLCPAYSPHETPKALSSPQPFSPFHRLCYLHTCLFSASPLNEEVPPEGATF